MELQFRKEPNQRGVGGNKRVMELATVQPRRTEGI